MALHFCVENVVFKNGPLAQLARALHLQCRGQGFEPLRVHNCNLTLRSVKILGFLLFVHGLSGQLISRGEQQEAQLLDLVCSLKSEEICHLIVKFVENFIKNICKFR